MYNRITPSNLTRFNAAKLAGNAKLMFIGDSNTVGEGAGAGPSFTENSRFNGYASLVLDTLGYHNQSCWADGNVPVNSITLPQYDPRVTFGAKWASDLSGSIGGNWLNVPSANIAGSGSFKLTCASNFDSFELYFPISTYGNNAVHVYVDSILVDTINQNQPAGFVKKTYTVTRGSHYIELSGNGLGQVYLNGILVKDSLNTKGYGLISGHCGGTVASTITTLPYQALAAVNVINPDLIIYNMTVNDCNASTTLSTYRNNLEIFLKNSTANGVLMAGFPSSSANTDGALLDQYSTKLQELASDYAWGYFDARSIFGASWNRANNLTLAKDANHPNVLGHQKLASGLSDYLLSIGA